MGIYRAQKKCFTICILNNNHTHYYSYTCNDFLLPTNTSVLEFMADNGFSAEVKRLGIPDAFIEHGEPQELWSECGYDTASIIKSAKKIKEEHLSAMMMTYELINEIKDKTK